jgi:RNA polymerase sigma-70 factor (ECF subfamily)
MTEGSFEEFFKPGSARAIVLLIAMGASRADAEDATQEAMILAWNQWDTIREPAAWVRRVAVRNYLRMGRRTHAQVVPLTESVPHPGTDPDLGSFEGEEQQVLRLLRALPAGQRAVAALHYDGLTCEEIASVLCKTPATVRSQLRHARRALCEVITSEASYTEPSLSRSDARDEQRGA